MGNHFSDSERPSIPRNTRLRVDYKTKSGTAEAILRDEIVSVGLRAREEVRKNRKERSDKGMFPLRVSGLEYTKWKMLEKLLPEQCVDHTGFAQLSDRFTRTDDLLSAEDYIARIKKHNVLNFLNFVDLGICIAGACIECSYNKWELSDYYSDIIDIYCTEDNFNTVVDAIGCAIRNIHSDIIIITRSKASVTLLYNENTGIRVFLKRYKSKAEILNSMNLGSDMYLYDGTGIYTNALGQFAYDYGMNIMDHHKFNIHYIESIKFYLSYGIGLFVPDIDYSKIISDDSFISLSRYMNISTTTRNDMVLYRHIVYSPLTIDYDYTYIPESHVYSENAYKTCNLDYLLADMPDFLCGNDIWHPGLSPVEITPKLPTIDEAVAHIISSLSRGHVARGPEILNSNNSALLLFRLMLKTCSVDEFMTLCKDFNERKFSTRQMTKLVERIYPLLQENCVLPYEIEEGDYDPNSLTPEELYGEFYLPWAPPN